MADGRAWRAVMDSPRTAADAGSDNSGSSCALAPALRSSAASSCGALQQRTTYYVVKQMSR